jgi:hypothetical protein
MAADPCYRGSFGFVRSCARERVDERIVNPIAGPLAHARSYTDWRARRYDLR